VTETDPANPTRDLEQTPDVVDELPSPAKAGPAEVGTQQLSFELSETWSAPLPPPQAFAQYDQILPGASERILKMAERDLDAKIEQDRKVTDAVINQSGIGLVVAATLATVALVASIVFFSLDNDIAGGILLGMPVVLLIRSFLTGSEGAKWSSAEVVA